MSANALKTADSHYFDLGLAADTRGETELAERYYGVARRVTWRPRFAPDAKRWWEKNASAKAPQKELRA
jgi:hypothetical protein